MNLAALWQLPMLFFCENNLYGMGASVDQTLVFHEEIYKMANTYHMPSKRVDGMDVLAVREATEEAVELVRGDGGPFFIEAMTYRFRGHSMADPTEYRAKSEEEEWRVKDPILALKDPDTGGGVDFRRGVGSGVSRGGEGGGGGHCLCR